MTFKFFILKNLMLIKKTLAIIMVFCVAYFIFGVLYWDKFDEIPYLFIVIGIGVAIFILVYIIKEFEKKALTEYQRKHPKKK